MCQDTCSCQNPGAGVSQWEKAGPALREHLDLRAYGTVLLMLYEPVIVKVSESGQLQAHSLGGSSFDPANPCRAYLVLSQVEVDRMLAQLESGGFCEHPGLKKALRQYAAQRAGMSKPDPRITNVDGIARLPISGSFNGVLQQVDGIDPNEEDDYGTGVVQEIVRLRELKFHPWATRKVPELNEGEEFHDPEHETAPDGSDDDTEPSAEVIHRRAQEHVAIDAHATACVRMVVTRLGAANNATENAPTSAVAADQLTVSCTHCGHNVHVKREDAARLLE